MPGKRYDLVDDGYDSRVPLHNDEAFQHGIPFPTKYIGTLDVPRPSSRVEIVAAMRRIRYEFKAKAIKKKKVTLVISSEGVRVELKKKKKKDHWSWDENKLVLMSHPIYRIFYVSHDSQDLKILSFIARDAATNVFKCNVFKTYKKSAAMRIVRTIGQAFEVCHKLSAKTGDHSEAPTNNERENRSSSEENERRVRRRSSRRSNSSNQPSSPRPLSTDGPPQYRETIPSVEERALEQAQQLLHNVAGRSEVDGLPSTTPAVPHINTATPVMLGSNFEPVDPDVLPITAQHQMQLLQSQLEQQTQQTQVSIAQVHLLKDQLHVESTARIEAQARIHQLILHNRDLLDHIRQLVGKISELETSLTGAPPSEEALMRIPPPIPSQMAELSSPVQHANILPEFQDIELQSNMPSQQQSMFENSNVTSSIAYADSPDSGHREMSSDSLANVAGQSDLWYKPREGTDSNATTLPANYSLKGIDSAPGGAEEVENSRKTNYNGRVENSNNSQAPTETDLDHVFRTKYSGASNNTNQQQRNSTGNGRIGNEIQLGVRSKPKSCGSSYGSTQTTRVTVHGTHSKELNKSTENTASLNQSSYSMDENNLERDTSTRLDNMTLEEFEALDS